MFDSEQKRLLYELMWCEEPALCSSTNLLDTAALPLLLLPTNFNTVLVSKVSGIGAKWVKKREAVALSRPLMPQLKPPHCPRRRRKNSRRQKQQQRSTTSICIARTLRIVRLMVDKHD